MKRRLGSVVLALALVASAQVARADTVLDGSADGAFFRIVVPTNWNGDLVVYNHGFSLAPPAVLIGTVGRSPRVSLGPCDA